jgi:hypothetical protein
METSITNSIENDSVETELLDLIDDFPNGSREMPLHHLASVCGCSADAIDLAERRARSPEWPPIDIAEEVAEGLPTGGNENQQEEIQVPAECGAFEQWRREVAAGVRKKTDIDALSRAAIHEANARDELLGGMQGAARQSRLDAADAIIDATAEHAA